MAHNQEGPIFWSHAPKGQAAVRGFSFSNGNTLEFVYPKLEAVTLAKLNIDTVPAIDPESEGRKPDQSCPRKTVKWSPSGCFLRRALAPRTTHLLLRPNATWHLSIRRIRRKPPAPVQVASAAPAPVVQPRRVRSAPVQIAKAEPAEAPRVHTPVRKLPQTASNLPLLLLLCVLSLFTAAALRFRPYPRMKGQGATQMPHVSYLKRGALYMERTFWAVGLLLLIGCSVYFGQMFLARGAALPKLLHKQRLVQPPQTCQQPRLQFPLPQARRRP